MSIEVDLGCNVLAVEKFIELNDTPSTYSGQAGKYAVVNGVENGLEFINTPVDGVETVSGDGVNNTDPANPVLSFPNGTEVYLVDGGIVSVTEAISDLSNGLTPNHSDLNLDDGTNPHGTTQSDVSLGNVDNTSDLAKPISTLTQTALDGKEVLLTDVTKTASFSPSGDDSINFICDSASAIVVTFDTGALTATNKEMAFFHKGSGALTFINGTGTLVGNPSTSFVSQGQFSTIYVKRLADGTYLLYGQTA